MAEKQVEIELNWENGNYFEMKLKPDDGDWLQVVRVDEQGNIATIWPKVEQICLLAFAKKCAEIGEEMRA